MKNIFFFSALLALALTLSACDHVLASEPATIKLSATEAKQAQSIAEQRQEIAFERQQIQNDYQTQMNQAAQRESELNLASEKLCYTLKKNHSMNPALRYYLDEWRGELRKQ